MQAFFRFVPALIYVAALFAVVLSLLIVRPTRSGGPFDLHCQDARYSDCRLVR
ncbi:MULTISPECIES: hypothetical protein [unclassified Rhizobium]|uniref:hypothetical protein n=1 Tax=unclassified Rhizobium TaxID=2613769 RepID=UPI0018EE29CD